MSKEIFQVAIESRDPALARDAIREIDDLLGLSVTPEQRATLLLNKAMCLQIIGDIGQARDHLALAQRESPDSPEINIQIRFLNGCLYGIEGNTVKSLEELSSVLAEYRDRLSHPELRFMYEEIQQRRGLAFVQLNRFKEAIPVLDESLSFKSSVESESDILANLGLCYLELGENDRARNTFLQARASGLSKQWEQSGCFYLGIAFAKLQQYTEAKQEFLACEQKAAQAKLPLLDIYSWLAYVCNSLGEQREAQHYARLAKPV